MEIASSGMATYGNSFQQVIGLVTSGTEIMQGRASQVARGLSTIAARIVKNQDALAEYGIQVEKTDGSLKSTFDVLSELKPKWDAMTDAQRVALGDTLAGQNQYKVLASVLQNFQHAIDATNTALESAGSAAKENAAYMESLEAKENALKAEFEDFANRVLSKDVVKGFLEAGTSMLDFANNDVGAAITRIGLLTTGMTGLTGIAGQTIGKIAEVGLQLKNLGVGGDSFLGMLASGKVALIVGGVVLAITALVEIIRAVNQAVENRKFENLVKRFEELDEQAKEAADNLADVKKRLDELNNTPAKDRGQDWQNEIDKLETLKQYYEYIEQMRQGQAAEAQAEAYSAPVEVGTTVTRKSVEVRGRTAQVKLEDIGKYANESNAVYELAAKENIQLTEKQTEALSKLTDETEIAAQGYQYLKENLESLGYIFSNTTQTAEEYTAAQSRNMSVLSSEISIAVSNGEEITQLQQDEYEGYIKASQGRYEYIKGLDDASDTQKAFAANYETMVRNFVKYNLSNELMDTTDAVTYLTNVLPDGAQAALEFAQAYGLIGKDVTFDSLGLVELADGALAL